MAFSEELRQKAFGRTIWKHKHQVLEGGIKKSVIKLMSLKRKRADEC